MPPAVSENRPAGRPLLQEPGPGAAAAAAVPLWRPLFLAALALPVCLVYWTLPRHSLEPRAGVVMHLPSYLGLGSGYLGENAEVTPAEHQILPPDTEFARKYYRDYPGPNDIFCSIVLSGAMQQSIHRPELCLVAQGWSIVNGENIPIRLESGHELTVRNLTIRRMVPLNGRSVPLTAYNMYWFVGDHFTTASHITRTFINSWDRIVHNRAHRWAYVTVSASITQGLRPGGLDGPQTRALLLEFIREIVPYFQKDEMPDPGLSAP